MNPFSAGWASDIFVPASELDLRMAHEQPKKLEAHVSGPADY